MPHRAGRSDRVLGSAGLIAVAVALLTTAILAALYYPTNDDALTYRFPRVMYYLSQGNLDHLATPDGRLDYYPLCGVFLYFLPGTWALDGRAFNVVGLAMWLAGGVAVLATARELGSSRIAAWIAAALYLTAPAVFISAASGNDDIIAGVPALCCVLFALSWWRSRSLVDAVLAGLGLGLSLGTKYHLLLYDLAGLTLAVVVMIRPRMRTFASRTLRDGWRHLLVAAAVAAYFVVPGLVINLVQGHALLRPQPGPEFSSFDGITNSPFSWTIAGINVAITVAQLFLGDLPNTLFFLSDAARRHAVEVYDAAINHHLFWWLSDAIPYSIPYYEFAGVTPPEVGYASSEASVTLGLLPWLLLPAAWVCARLVSTRAGAVVALCLSVSLILRFVSFGMHFRYGESAGIYSAFAITIAAPALAWVWDARRLTSAPMRSVIVALWCAALAVDVAIGIDAAVKNPSRSLTQLAATGFSVPQRKSVSPDLAAAIAGMDRIDVIYTHYELEAFSLMMAKMDGRYASRLLPTAEPGHSELYSYPADARSGNVPLLVADAAPGRLTLLGSYAGVGQERVFGTGELPGTPGRTGGGYVVLRLAFDETPGDPDVVRGIGVAGLVGARPRDDFDYSLVQITPSSRRRTLLDWTGAGTLPTKPVTELQRFTTHPPVALRVALAEPSDQGYIAVRLRSKSNPGDVSETWVPLDRSAEIVPPRESVPDYPLSATIDFKAGGLAGDFEGPGWSTAEASGTWSIGGESALDLRLDKAPDAPLQLVARVLPFLAPGRTREDVSVMANDVPVATWTFDKAGWATMAADIPLSLLAGRRDLRLSFMSEGVASPAKLGLSADPRPLKLLFETAAVTEQPAPPADTGSYEPGQVISFTAAGGSAGVVGAGWSTPETSGTWMIGAESAMRFALPPTPRVPLHLSARVLPFVPPGRSLSVIVSARGAPVATWTFTTGDWTEVEAMIPAEALGPDGHLGLTFTADGVASPAALGLGADTRDLKLMVQRMSLSE